jgi:hypothetical protein
MLCSLALSFDLLFVSCLFFARLPRWRPASRSQLVTGQSRRGGPFAVTPSTPSHVPAGRVTAVTALGRRPEPLPLATSVSFTHVRLRDRSVIAWSGTTHLFCVSSSSCDAFFALPQTCSRSDPKIASSIQNSLGRISPFCCRAVVATLQPVPG